MSSTVSQAFSGVIALLGGKPHRYGFLIQEKLELINLINEDGKHHGFLYWSLRLPRFFRNTVLPFRRAEGFPYLGGHNLTSVFDR